MPFEETKKLADKIDGWILDKEGEFLYKNAKNCQGKGVIVEIGSWKGKSTVYLAKGSKTGNNVRIYAIDPHISEIEHKMWLGGKSSFEEFKQNIKNAKVEDVIEPIVKPSQEVAKNWDKPIEFLWIDGDHSYQGAKLDFKLYLPFVVENGIIAFHDSTQDDVQRVVQEVFQSKKLKNLGLIETITFGQKFSGNLSLKDRIQKKWILFLNLSHHYFRKIPLPLIVKKNLKTKFKKIFNSKDLT